MRLFLLLLLLPTIVFADEPRLQWKQLFTEIPDTSIGVLKESFSKEALPYWGIILGSTYFLYVFDEEIVKEMQKKGRDWNIGNHDNTKPVITAGGQELVRMPTDVASGLYFLGDGWTHVAIGGGFMVAGAVTDSNYHFNTGLMIWHGMITSTIFNQALKRSFGRESPEVSTSQRGSWNLFPSFNDYNSKTASYDAMPSGHVMTATTTFTILYERYPDQRSVIVPVGALWVSGLMFGMMNLGVHWASDYPLGIAMGYMFGKYAARMGKEKEKEKNPEMQTSWQILPTSNGLLAMRKF